MITLFKNETLPKFYHTILRGYAEYIFWIFIWVIKIFYFTEWLFGNQCLYIRLYSTFIILKSAWTWEISYRVSYNLKGVI